MTALLGPRASKRTMMSTQMKFGIQRLLCFAAAALALAALAACSSGTLFNATPVPLAFGISGAAPQVGHTSQLKAIAQMSDGSAKDVTSDTTGWTSSDVAIATVSSTGLVTGVASGSVTVTATYQGFTGAVPLIVP